MKEIENYTIEHVSKALYEFVKNVEVTETKIGTYSESKRGGKKDIVASGHQVYDVNRSIYACSPSTIYTFISSTILDKSPIFESKFSISLNELMKKGISYEEGISKEDEEVIMQKLKNLNSRKNLIIPVIPKRNYKVTYKPDIKSKEITSLERCFSIKWSTDEKTYKLKCEILFESGKSDNRKITTLPVTDYGKAFIPEKMEFWSGINNCTMSLLEMTDECIIKPIEITDGIQSIVVDNMYVYWINNGITFIVGDWDTVNKKIIYRQDLTKRSDRVELLKFLDKNIPLIGGHRHLIAPYNLFDVHKHNIKIGKGKKK